MYSIVKAFAVVLVLLAFMAPISSTAYCSNDLDAECETECTGEDYPTPALTGIEAGAASITLSSEPTYPTDSLWIERLPATDIFRPPIAS